MKNCNKAIVVVLLASLLVGFLSSNGWTQEANVSNDQMNLIDLFVARPLGIIAAAVGTCLFVASLPFTLPTRSTEEAFNLFVVEPWKFSFVREFPDESSH